MDYNYRSGFRTVLDGYKFPNCHLPEGNKNICEGAYHAYFLSNVSNYTVMLAGMVYPPCDYMSGPSQLPSFNNTKV
jgi:hypothetical protein